MLRTPSLTRGNTASPRRIVQVGGAGENNCHSIRITGTTDHDTQAPIASRSAPATLPSLTGLEWLPTASLLVSGEGHRRRSSCQRQAVKRPEAFRRCRPGLASAPPARYTDGSSPAERKKPRARTTPPDFWVQLPGRTPRRSPRGRSFVTCTRKPKFPARVGPTRRCVFRTQPGSETTIRRSKLGNRTSQQHTPESVSGDNACWNDCETRFGVTSDHARLSSDTSQDIVSGQGLAGVTTKLVFASRLTIQNHCRC
jgi:hypothetical protein